MELGGYPDRIWPRFTDGLGFETEIVNSQRKAQSSSSNGSPTCHRRRIQSQCVTQRVGVNSLYP